MGTISALSHWLSRFVYGAGRLGAWLLPVLMIVIVFDVVGRKFFNTGSSMLQDLEWHLHGAALLLAFGFCYLRDAHVRVDLLREAIPNRSKIILEIAGIVLLLTPYLVVLMDYGFEFAARAYRTNEGSIGGAGLSHRWIIKSMMPIGFFIMLMAALSVLLRLIVLLKRNGPIEAAFPGNDQQGEVSDGRYS